MRTPSQISNVSQLFKKEGIDVRCSTRGQQCLAIANYHRKNSVRYANSEKETASNRSSSSVSSILPVFK
jgi:hydrogenase maturation factor